RWHGSHERAAKPSARDAFCNLANHGNDEGHTGPSVTLLSSASFPPFHSNTKQVCICARWFSGFLRRRSRLTDGWSARLEPVCWSSSAPCREIRKRKPIGWRRRLRSCGSFATTKTG